MKARRQVLLGMFVLGVAAFILVGAALYVESIGVRSPEEGDTITELTRELWAHQPWVVLLGTHMLAMPVWFLAGHFFASSSDDYKRIRLAAMSQAELAAALREKERP